MKQIKPKRIQLKIESSFINNLMCLSLLYLLSILTVLAAPEQEEKLEEIRIESSLNKTGAVYNRGENIEFKILLIDNSNKKKAVFLDCELFFNGKSIEKKIIPASDTCVFSIFKDTPGWIAVKASACDINKKMLLKQYPKDQFDKFVSGGIGAMIAPYEIPPASNEPDDFDSFWQTQRESLDKIPVKAVRTPVAFTGPLKDKILCYDVKVDCAGSMPVSGYLGIPANAREKTLPALVFFDGAGVRSADKPTWYQGAIAFHINAHGIENGQNNDYYRKLEQSSLKDYKFQGINNRNDFYFREMHVRGMRALDYLKTLPEWDGKNLFVIGGSMGGGQAIAAAALDPQVTTCMAFIPAMGDLDGDLAQRLPAYPNPLSSKNDKAEKDSILETVKYYDSTKFAKRIKANVILSTGYIDFICPPSSVYLIYNSLPNGVNKKIIAYPSKGHEYYTPPEAKEILEKLYRPCLP